MRRLLERLRWGLWLKAGSESTVGYLGPQNEELQPRGMSSPVVQPEPAWVCAGCAAGGGDSGVYPACAPCVGGDSGMLTASTPRRWQGGEHGPCDKGWQGHTYRPCRGCRGAAGVSPGGRRHRAGYNPCPQGGGSGGCAAWTVVGGGRGGAQPQGEGHRAVHRLCCGEGGSGAHTVTAGDSRVGSPGQVAAL